jgi:hypothetical protein
MTVASESLSARDYVSAWLVENHARLGLELKRLARAESPAQILSAWLETPEFLIDVAAWDHAYCLDILILEKTSGNTVFSEAGSCETTNGLEVRMQSFASWLKDNVAST